MEGFWVFRGGSREGKGVRIFVFLFDVVIGEEERGFVDYDSLFLLRVFFSFGVEIKGDRE